MQFNISVTVGLWSAQGRLLLSTFHSTELTILYLNTYHNYMIIMMCTGKIVHNYSSYNPQALYMAFLGLVLFVESRCNFQRGVHVGIRIHDLQGSKYIQQVNRVWPACICTCICVLIIIPLICWQVV